MVRLRHKLTQHGSIGRELREKRGSIEHDLFREGEEFYFSQKRLRKIHHVAMRLCQIDFMRDK
jgi:hypothetical protein